MIEPGGKAATLETVLKGQTYRAHSREESVETKLQRIAEKAKREPEFKFSSLFHLMNEELLLGCFERLRNNAASGIDEVTKEQYAEQLEWNVQQLVERLHQIGLYPPAGIESLYPKAGNWIVEADIRGFFDNVDQDQLMKFLEHRIIDKRALRYIKRFLKAGIQEDGACRASERGTPQGALCKALHNPPYA